MSVIYISIKTINLSKDCWTNINGHETSLSFQLDIDEETISPHPNTIMLDLNEVENKYYIPFLLMIYLNIINLWASIMFMKTLITINKYQMLLKTVLQQTFKRVLERLLKPNDISCVFFIMIL